MEKAVIPYLILSTLLLLVIFTQKTLINSLIEEVTFLTENVIEQNKTFYQLKNVTENCLQLLEEVTSE